MFDPSRKRTIASYPQNIGIITSESGAVLQDCLKVWGHSVGLKIWVFNALMQGKQAPESVIRQLVHAQESSYALDAILIARGGGAYEDLAAFNDEALAYAVSDAKIPIVSAIGHETDFTILDFVADVRASTPTAAAQMLTVDQEQLNAQLLQWQARLTQQLERALAWQNNQIKLARIQLINLKDEKLRLFQAKLDTNRQTLNHHINQSLKETLHQIDRYRLILEAFHPEQVLKQGYAMLLDDSNQLLRFEKIKIGQRIWIKTKAGLIEATAKNIIPNN